MKGEETQISRKKKKALDIYMYATCELLASFLVSSVFFSIEVFCGKKNKSSSHFWS